MFYPPFKPNDVWFFQDQPLWRGEHRGELFRSGDEESQDKRFKWRDHLRFTDVFKRDGYDVLTEDGFLDHVCESGDKLRAGIGKLVEKYGSVLEGVRGRGLMIGIVVKAPHTNAKLGEAARENDLLTVVAGENVLRMLPPLTIGDTEIGEALDALDKACAKLAAGDNG